MIKRLTVFFLLLAGLNTFSQTVKPAFKDGEYLKYRINYSNFFNAGMATLKVNKTSHNGKEAYHVKGYGKTTGVISWFFQVKDDYQTFFYKRSQLPYRFIRKINEGGYTKNRELFFNQNTNKVLVKDYKKKTATTYTTHRYIQDMLSTLYYLRNQNLSNLFSGDEISLSMFFDDKNYKFKLKYLGTEIIKTKFGKVKCLKFMPIVQAGRVFKEQESITAWVSADKNKIPLRIKADLAVGSLRADLDVYKGLANSFPIIF
ncbi:MAG: ATP-dependent exonuclease [Flavobacteriales bacterium]|nr:MAG: ATP-dependent exonuclease [Flavobacteriales bacterium]